MTLWNLLVVVCFLVLYLAVSLVFVQVRRLRMDMKAYAALVAKRPESRISGESSRECAEAVLRELSAVEDKLTQVIHSVPGEIQPELEEIRKELRYIGRPTLMSAQPQPSMPTHHGGHSGSAGRGPDSYREARLLLANGVDEERVIDETGLTVEEVSLLKTLAIQESTKGDSRD
ncbi:MAG: hypothetical protein H7831_16300 [Magnetococcus sp. WYHC-3]